VTTTLTTGTKTCAICGRCDSTVLTQPAAPFRIGSLPGSEAIAQDAQWAAICTACIRANNAVLDAAYKVATSPRQRRADRRLCAPTRYLP
jgi:hypothetical protein